MKKVKLNLGCASRLLSDYINIDLDSLEEIKKRYPNIVVPSDGAFMVGNALSLDFFDGSVDEVRADALLEHLSFLEEPMFFYEAQRVLKPGGTLRFSVPDFEDAVRKWLDADDDWKGFFRNDDEAIREQHWFGNYSYSTNNRWGYIMASLFGPQNGVGQFHKNAYTEKKIKAICKKLGFAEPTVERFLWKEDRDLMLRVSVNKL